MVTREEKNKKIRKKLNREKNINYSRNIIKVFLLIGFMFVLVFLNLRYVGTGFIKTKEFIIKDSLIPMSFHGKKILHFSDLLYGSTIFEDDLDYLEKEFQKIKPDIVIFTGDILDKNYNISKESLNKLKDFFNNIPYTIGKYSVKGDFDQSTFDLIMNEADFNILDNEYKLVYYKDNNPISLIGFNSNNISLEKIDNEKINGLYKISLIHNFDYYNQSFNSNLILAGHNLNGEIYIPYYQGLLGNNIYNKSYYEIENSKVYISNGLGSIHKLRMFNHPSINVYRLMNY